MGSLQIHKSGGEMVTAILNAGGRLKQEEVSYLLHPPLFGTDLDSVGFLRHLYLETGIYQAT
jgi:hypothetical protein